MKCPSSRSIRLAVLASVIVSVALLLVFRPQVRTRYLVHRFDTSITTHAEKDKDRYQLDFEESIELLEILKQQGHSDLAVQVLIDHLESGKNQQQMTAMILLQMIDSSHTRPAVPILRKLASDRKTDEAIRLDAQTTLLKL